MKPKVLAKVCRELRREVMVAIKNDSKFKDTVAEAIAVAIEPALQEELDDLDAFLTLDNDALCVLVGWGQGNACVQLPIELDHENLLRDCDDTAIIRAIDNFLPELAKLRAGAMAKLQERIEEYGTNDWCPPGHLEELRRRAPTIHPPLGFIGDDK